MSDEKNIVLVKRHIKNLINGYDIGKHEMLELIKAEIAERIKNKLDYIFSSNNIESLVENTAKRTVHNYLTALMGKPSHPRESESYFERIVRDQCKLIVEEEIRKKFSISVNVKDTV